MIRFTDSFYPFSIIHLHETEQAFAYYVGNKLGCPGKVFLKISIQSHSSFHLNFGIMPGAHYEPAQKVKKLIM